jgi:hypothetical protein
MSTGGCDRDEGTNPVSAGSGEQIPSPTLQSFVVGAAGDTLVYRSAVEDVTVTLTIPAGAIDADTTITIDHAQNFSTAVDLVSGAVFEFGPVTRPAAAAGFHCSARSIRSTAR